MHYREIRHRSVEILWRARNVTAWRQRDWNFECPERSAKRRGVLFGTVASIPPNLKSNTGASSPHLWAHVPPTFGLNPVPFPFGLRFFPASPPWPYPPPFLPLSLYSASLCFIPLSLYVPPPILVPSSSLSRGASHLARGSSQPSSVSSPADPGRARPTNGLWTAFWGQNSYSGDGN